MLNKKDSML